MQEKFSYSSQPHAAPTKRKNKFRDTEEDDGKLGFNMMNDPRVVRGNTYAAKVLTTSMKREQDMQMQTTTQRIKSEAGLRKSKDINRAMTPPPVDGRVHMNMQTENYLEELSDKPIEIDADTQTHPFMDRPASPLFVPAKTGKDTSTQIEPGDLFDFDLEVSPILEVLVGKTIHVAMIELMQEEELEAIKRDQEEYEAIRNIELAEVQRLEAEARRRAEEKERRVQQERKRLQERAELEEKIAARAFSTQYLSTLHLGVMNELFEIGFFYDPVKKEAEEIFMSDLVKNLKKSVDSYRSAESILEEMLLEACERAKGYQRRASSFRAELIEKQRLAELELKLKAEEEAKRKAEEEAAAREATEENTAED